MNAQPKSLGLKTRYFAQKFFIQHTRALRKDFSKFNPERGEKKSP